MPRLKRRRCLTCQARLSPLLYLSGRGIPHGREGHNVVFDYDMVTLCSGCALTSVERGSHDCWTHEEPWDMYWWFDFDAESSKLLSELTGGWSRPLSTACRCPLHLGLGRALEKLYRGGDLKLRLSDSGFEVQGLTYRLTRR